MPKIISASFTGHRYASSAKNYKDAEKLIDMALDRGINHFYCGMALGFDQICAEILAERRLSWDAIVPCIDQDAKWSQNQKHKYHKLLKQADKKVVLFAQYSNGVMQARNEYMIKRSQLLIAFWDGTQTGGTFHTVSLALGKNIPIIRLNPSTKEFSETQQKWSQLNLF
jgi:uncharacterized phage-like protein YoqJ